MIMNFGSIQNCCHGEKAGKSSTVRVIGLYRLQRLRNPMAQQILEPIVCRAISYGTNLKKNREPAVHLFREIKFPHLAADIPLPASRAEAVSTSASVVVDQ